MVAVERGEEGHSTGDATRQRQHSSDAPHNLPRIAIHSLRERERGCTDCVCVLDAQQVKIGVAREEEGDISWLAAATREWRACARSPTTRVCNRVVPATVTRTSTASHWKKSTGDGDTDRDDTTPLPTSSEISRNSLYATLLRLHAAHRIDSPSLLISSSPSR